MTDAERKEALATLLCLMNQDEIPLSTHWENIPEDLRTKYLLQAETVISALNELEALND